MSEEIHTQTETSTLVTESTEAIINYILHLADNSLILGHRNSEWAGHGPILEQDIAISNIALDLIGQSRNLYQYAATLVNNPGQIEIFGGGKDQVTEDDLAYLRDAWDFKNCLLVEQPMVIGLKLFFANSFLALINILFIKNFRTATILN